MRSVFVAWLLTLVWLGCGSSDSVPSGDQSAFTENRPQAVPGATKQLGEDCQKEGRSTCLSGLCLHVGAGPEEGYVCSRSCTGDGECPASWRCLQVYPSPEGWLCVPPGEQR
jgi:hypothetical protein